MELKEEIKEYKVNGLNQFLPFEEIKIQDNKSCLLPEKKDSTSNHECACSQLLVVDDDFTLREVLCNFSLKCNIKFEQAQNGLEAIDLVKKKGDSNCCKTYKLILMDFNMPLMNGVESAIQIQRYLFDLNLQTKTAIILLSGLGPEEHKVIEGMPKNIFNEIEEKPLSLLKFKAILSKYIFK